jgi:oligopeptide/dipeptide ABC transporter ATP-binding protein
MSGPILCVDELRTYYPARRNLVDWARRRPRRVVRAVDGVSFEVRQGEILALVGETGCGKTSTIQTVIGATPATSGQVVIDGRDVTRLSGRRLRAVRRITQMIFQDPYESLNPRIRIRKAVEEPLQVHKLVGSRIERRRLATEALERVGLTPAELFVDRFPHELSGGQRQRVAIAAALILDPRLLLADEPVSMLDVSIRAGVLSLIDDLRRERRMAVVLVTHDLSTAAHYADRIAVMYLGRIVEEGPTADVLRNPQHPYTQALLSVVPKSDPRDRFVPRVLEGETPNPANVPEGCRFHPRCPVATGECAVVDPVLAPPRTSHEAGHRVACILTQERLQAGEDREAAGAHTA